jgi:primosomal protein N' (replication factor Y) (superfamily II helicase)
MTRPAPQAVQVAVPVPLPELFDYLPAASGQWPEVGSRVLVPFGRRRLVGLVMGQGPASTDGELKPIEQVLDERLIDPGLIELIEWCSRYYGFAPGEAVNLLLPGALRRIRPFRPPPPEAFALTAAGRDAKLDRAPRQAEIRRWLESGPVSRETLLTRGGSAATLARMHDAGLVHAVPGPLECEQQCGPELNLEQRQAVAAILHQRHGFAALLLAGVTGSGKTEVYLHVAQRLLNRGRQVLILIPEIGLTPQLVRRIESRLGRRAYTYHSGLSEGERLATWQAARDGRAEVLVGTRSAVFLPLIRPGLIVVDEEHDGSFKQQDGARYHGRDVAVLRARRLDIPIVLGSATPSLESLNNVEAGRYRLLELTRRAGQARQPRWKVIDQRGQPGPLAPLLQAAIERHLENGGQVLLYRNRRGYAPVLMCNGCGWQADCHRCSAHLTWHQQISQLQCHHCGTSARGERRGPRCGSPDLAELGAGTERLEEALSERFAPIPVHRVDRDSMTARDDFENLLTTVRAGEPCILVGTQMLAKGHHLPGVTLAAVLDVDQALFSADFRAPERLGQAVCQVAGRAGRGQQAGEFLLLTRHPEHPLLADLVSGQYLPFATTLLAERRSAALPPATSLALIRAQAHQAEPARRFLAQCASRLAGHGVEISGPIPAIMNRRGGYWRFQLWLQANERGVLLRTLSTVLPMLHGLPMARKVRWHLDMDPTEL